MSPTGLVPKCLAGVAWIERGQRAEYANAHRLYGIQRGDGRWLSFDGIAPYAPAGGRRAAAEVAATIIDDGTLHWLTEVTR